MTALDRNRIKCRLSCNEQLLRQALDKPSRKLLLRIIDDLNLLSELDSEKAYRDGIRQGIHLMSDEDV